jgi:myo-inositol-1(or 4)-monophosphatase
MAAGIVIVREAGGVVTDYKGGSDIFYRSEIIAANSELQQKIIKSIAE